MRVVTGKPLSADELARVDPLLREPLRAEHVKRRLLGVRDGTWRS
jgi:hypothetical protein